MEQQHNPQEYSQFYAGGFANPAGDHEGILEHGNQHNGAFAEYAQPGLWDSANPPFPVQYASNAGPGFPTPEFANAAYEQQPGFGHQGHSQSPPPFQNSQYGQVFNDLNQPSAFHNYSNGYATHSPQPRQATHTHPSPVSHVNSVNLNYGGQQQQQPAPERAAQQGQFLQHQFVAFEHDVPPTQQSFQAQSDQANTQPRIDPSMAQQIQPQSYQSGTQATFTHSQHPQQQQQQQQQPLLNQFESRANLYNIPAGSPQPVASRSQQATQSSTQTSQHYGQFLPQQTVQKSSVSQQNAGLAHNSTPLQSSITPQAPIKISPRPPQATIGPPRVLEDVLKSRTGGREEQLFPGATNLVLAGRRKAEIEKVPEMPAVVLDISKDLGRAHMGREHPLPCELIKAHIDTIKEHPELNDSSRIQLAQQLKLQGKTFSPRVYLLGKESLHDADDSDSEVEEIRSATRPSNPADAAAWDAIGIVHLDSEAAKDKKSIGIAVKRFGDFIKGIREDVKAEPENKHPTQLSPHQERLYRAIDAAYEKGDDQVLINLGGNQPLISHLVFSLHNLPKTADLSGKLPKAVLRLLSECSLQQDTLTKVKFSRLEKRLLEKGDEEIKTLLKDVHKAVKKDGPAEAARSPSVQGTAAPQQAKSLPAGTGPSTDKTMASKPLKSGTRAASDQTSTKRPRDDDSDSRASKKFAADPANSTTQATSKASPTKNAAATTQQPTGPNKPWVGNTLLPGKARPATKPTVKTEASKSDVVKTEVVKTSGLSKADLSKLVATKRDPLKAESTKIKKTPSSRTEAPQSSKLGALLQEISMPKKQPVAIATPEAVPEKPETPEEKAKRLRKESRRKLRVSWKEGDELTQVRVFHKDVDEDEGRADNMIRDARDDRSEGMVLKQSLKRGGVELDDDEDNDIPYRPWVAPTPLDLSSLPAEKRGSTFVTRGGLVPVETQQQKDMQERENNVLMVVYTATSDIPPTPKSPPPSHNEPQAQAPPPGVRLPTNDPKYTELHQRWNDSRTMSHSWASYNALKRAEARKLSGTTSSHSPSLATPTSSTLMHPWPSSSRAGEVVKLLKSDKVKNWKDHSPFDRNDPQTQRRYEYPDPAVQVAADAVEDLAAYLKDRPFPATEPPAYITDPMRRKEWYEGYNREQERKQAHVTTPATAAVSPADYAAVVAWYTQLGVPVPPEIAAQAGQAAAPPQQVPGNANAQIQALMATLTGGSAQQAQPSYPAPPVVAQQHGAPLDPQLQALLASLGAGPQQSQPPVPVPVSVPNPNDPTQQAYVAAMAQWAAQQHQPAATPPQLQSIPPPPPVTIQGFQSTDDYGLEQGHQREHYDSRGGGAAGARAPRGKREARELKEAREARDLQDPSIPNHLRGINRNLIGTKPCTFWKQNMCAKGDKCTFRHD